MNKKLKQKSNVNFRVMFCLGILLVTYGFYAGYLALTVNLWLLILSVPAFAVGGLFIVGASLVFAGKA